MTIWSEIERIEQAFEKVIGPTSRLCVFDPNYKDSKSKIPVSRQKLMELVRECVDVKKLSFTDTTIELGVSPTTVRRICRTLKIGPYREQIPSERRSKSSQTPYGWKRVNGLLEKDPVEWGWIEQMQQFRREGKSLHWIARQMELLEVKTKNGGRWYAKTVSQILAFNK